MNRLRTVSALLLAASLVGAAGQVIARDWHGGGHGDVGVRVVVDPFWYGPGYYPYPYGYPPLYYPPYYYPPAIGVVPAMPQEYIERADEAGAAPGASAYWYWCPGAQAYYPQVKQCPGGWVAVPPRAPAAAEEGRK